MIRNFFKTAWRNLLKHKGFSAIKIVGLAIGMAACLLISLFILHEKRYDAHVPNAGNIYRLIQYFNIEGKDYWGAHEPAPMAPTLVNEFGEVENAGRIMDNNQVYGAGENEVRAGDATMQYHENGFAYADQSILDIFQIPFVQGNRSTALTSPFSLVFSESKAKKYFNNENPVGKTIYLNGNNEQPYTVTGVMQDFPDNSSLDYDFFLTLTGFEIEEGEQTRWSQRNYQTFLQVKPGTDITRFEKKLSGVMLTNYIVPFYRGTGRASNADLLSKSSSFELQPLQKIHLYSDEIPDGHTRGNIRFIWLFGTIAVFILIIAGINFVNLSTAQSATRAKEVGLRKVVGSSRNSLMGRFLTESVIITVLAGVLGVLTASLLLPVFNSMAGKNLSIPWTSPDFILLVMAFAVIVGIIAGIYPALYLSGFNPIHTLKGTIRQGGKFSGLRNGLVVFQFSISIILIAATLLIRQQMNFILTKELGYNKDQVIQVQGVDATGKQLAAFKEELKKINGVQNVSISSYLPVDGTMRNSNNYKVSNLAEESEIQAQSWAVDEDYIETLGMRLVEGRNFSPGGQDVYQSMIINQVMASSLHLSNPVGKQIYRSGRPYTIIGIVEDFNYQSLRENVKPLALFYTSNSTMISVKTAATGMPGIVSALQATWKKFVPDLEFRYSFMDESYAQMHANVQRMGNIFSSFSLLAIVIACLGLFSLSAFVMEQRRKEISIRKVLGASVQNIFRLTVRHFLLLVGISWLIAIPVSYYLMQKWLEDFAYRVDITWQLFAVAGGVSLLIALCTISYHAIKSALVNPVKSLRTE